MSDGDLDKLKEENELLKAELEHNGVHRGGVAKLPAQYVACWWVWGIGATLWALAWLHLVPNIVGWVGFVLGCGSSLYSIFLSRRKS